MKPVEVIMEERNACTCTSAVTKSYQFIFIIYFYFFISSALLVQISLLVNEINERGKKKERKEKDQKVRCELDLKSHAGYLGSKLT